MSRSVPGADAPLFLKGQLYGAAAAGHLCAAGRFTKGNVYINGFHLGRYWNPAGPQKTLYLPAPLLREGENELAVLELEESTVRRAGTFDRLRGFGIKI